MQTPKELLTKQLLFSYNVSEDTDTIVFTAGIHGNEHAGVLALQKIFLNQTLDLKGNVYALLGNMKALSKDERFIDFDLNRLWTFEKMESDYDMEHKISEIRERNELVAEIDSIIEKHGHRKIVFIDLHTTSSISCPFIPFNDSLQNRAVTQNFPVPLVLGIEEYIQGALTTYINDLKHVAFAFEAGRHQDASSIELHSTFIQLCLYHQNLLEENPITLANLTSRLKSAIDITPGFYEISYHHGLNGKGNFQMKPGYKNFQPIKKGELLAIHQEKEVLSPQSGRIFMPSYQKLSLDGFFIIRKVSNFWLLISKSLRKLKIASLLPLLPGIRRHPFKTHIYIADRKIVRFLHREIFHLLGYRILPAQGNYIEVVRRDL